MFLLSSLWARVLFDSIAYACDYVCEFWNEILLRGEECKTWKNLIFLKNGKSSNNCRNGSGKPGKFSKYRMVKQTSPLDSSCEI